MKMATKAGVRAALAGPLHGLRRATSERLGHAAIATRFRSQRAGAPSIRYASLPAPGGSLAPPAGSDATTGGGARFDSGASTGGHPLADALLAAGLRKRAEEIAGAFERIEPLVREIASRQFEPSFPAWARSKVLAELGLDLPPSVFRAEWAEPLDARALYARCVIGTFCRLIGREFDRGLARLSEGDNAAELIHRWGFHAIDVTPCADGRLSGVIDYILRIPPAVIAYRKSYAGALFDLEESLRHWEAVELRRWREHVPNAPEVPTRFLKLGVYHYSSIDPSHEGCAAHGKDRDRAAGALLERLRQLEQAVESTHCCGAKIATLLIGVDTDTDAIRMHVPDSTGTMNVGRCVDNLELYERTRHLPREDAKLAIREAVAACAGVAADDAKSEGMRWFCGYLLKNNIGQIDAVRSWHGGSYADRGHTERLIVLGDGVDDVQLRNLAFQAQMDTVEEGAADLDIGVKILRGLHAPRSLSVPVLVHFRYDPRIPGAKQRAMLRAQRLEAAIESRYAPLVTAGHLHVEAVVRAGDSSTLDAVPPPESDR